MAATVSLAGIDEAISNLNYRNPQALKSKLVHAIRSFYEDEHSLGSLEKIDALELVKALWDTGDDPDVIRAKRKNLSSTKSSLNSDLKGLFKEGNNPDGVVIGRDNVFVMSDEAKDKLISTFGVGAADGEPVSLQQIAQSLSAIKEILSMPGLWDNAKGSEASRTLEDLRDAVQHLGNKIGVDEKASVPLEAGEGEQLPGGVEKGAQLAEAGEDEQLPGGVEKGAKLAEAEEAAEDVKASVPPEAGEGEQLPGAVEKAVKPAEEEKAAAAVSEAEEPEDEEPEVEEAPEEPEAEEVEALDEDLEEAEPEEDVEEAHVVEEPEEAEETDVVEEVIEPEEAEPEEPEEIEEIEDETLDEVIEEIDADAALEEAEPEEEIEEPEVEEAPEETEPEEVEAVDDDDVDEVLDELDPEEDLQEEGLDEEVEEEPVEEPEEVDEEAVDEADVVEEVLEPEEAEPEKPEETEPEEPEEIEDEALDEVLEEAEPEAEAPEAERTIEEAEAQEAEDLKIVEEADVVEEVVPEERESKEDLDEARITEALDIVNRILSSPEAMIDTVGTESLDKLEGLKNIIQGLSQKPGPEAEQGALDDTLAKAVTAGAAGEGEGAGEKPGAGEKAVDDVLKEAEPEEVEAEEAIEEAKEPEAEALEAIEEDDLEEVLDEVGVDENLEEAELEEDVEEADTVEEPEEIDEEDIADETDAVEEVLEPEVEEAPGEPEPEEVEAVDEADVVEEVLEPEEAEPEDAEPEEAEPEEIDEEDVVDETDPVEEVLEAEEAEPEEVEEVEDDALDEALDVVDEDDTPEELETDEELDEAEVEDGLEEIEVADDLEAAEADDDAEEAELLEDSEQVGLPVGSLGEGRPDAGADVDVEKARRLAEAFDGHLGAMERFYNQYLLIPSGEYIVGSMTPKMHERPGQTVRLPSFYIGKFPVINSLFEIFVEKTGYVTAAEKQGYGTVFYGRLCKEVDETTGLMKFRCNGTVKSKIVRGAFWYQPSGPGSTLHHKRDHPVVQVSLEDAMAFAAWTGKRLPTEDEWEAASRTADGYVLPWGMAWKDQACNIEDTAVGETTPVDAFRDLTNELAIADTLGNVLEWTSDLFQPSLNVKSAPRYHVAKGGSWVSEKEVRLFSRFKVAPDAPSNILGFRCVAY